MAMHIQHVTPRIYLQSVPNHFPFIFVAGDFVTTEKWRHYFFQWIHVQIFLSVEGVVNGGKIGTCA